MKKLVILIAIAIIGGHQIGFAQKKQSSTYNFERAKELVQQEGTHKEVLALLNKRLKFTFDTGQAPCRFHRLRHRSCSKTVT